MYFVASSKKKKKKKIVYWAHWNVLPSTNLTEFPLGNWLYTTHEYSLHVSCKVYQHMKFQHQELLICCPSTTKMYIQCSTMVGACFYFLGIRVAPGNQLPPTIMPSPCQLYSLLTCIGDFNTGSLTILLFSHKNLLIFVIPLLQRKYFAMYYATMVGACFYFLGIRVAPGNQAAATCMQCCLQVGCHVYIEEL